VGKRLTASISLDLDDHWTYLKTHGNKEWETFPSYLPVVIPRVLDILDELNIHITFFIIAQDAVFKKNHPLLKEIVYRGHDIGNHSFNHDPWLHLYSEEKLHEELSMSEQFIGEATGYKPLGFRGPGFSYSPKTIKVLIERDYLFDATTLPTFLAPLARMYFLLTANVDPSERAKRKSLFGKFSDGFRKNTPHLVESGQRKLLQMPVTTMPIFRIPFHASYILYLNTFNKNIALTYFQMALHLCKLTKTEPSILLHPLDFLGRDDVDNLSFFPAMKLEHSVKISIMKNILIRLNEQFNLKTLNEHAKASLNQFLDSKMPSKINSNINVN